MEWKDVDWQVLRGLRDRFLNPTAGDYWHTRRELEHYDLTFAARIASKWDAVWEEVGAALPADLAVWDWGCGTGIASRTLAAAQPGKLRSVWLTDRSALARGYARESLGKRGVAATDGGAEPAPKPYWLLASHVWNELGKEGRRAFLSALTQAEGFVWVEPGTPESSKGIVEVRESVRDRFHFLAPCPHSGPCGLTAPERTRDWCHHFAPPAPEVFTSAEWRKFSDELKIDLRALPVSYLVGVKHPTDDKAQGRVLGRPRVHKGYATALVCRSSGVSEEKLRGDAFHKQAFKHTTFSHWW